MEERKLTQEELYEAEAAFNIASLLGTSILAAYFQIMHPDYEPSRIVVTGSPDAPLEEPAEEDDDEEEPEEDISTAPAADDSVIRSNEANLENQIAQLAALYHPDIAAFLKASALYDMFRLAASQFGLALQDDNPLQALTPAFKKKLALAWVIVKRVFAVRHTDETLYIISATERAIRDARARSFSPMDDVDRQFIIETCGLFIEDFEKDVPIAQVLERISQIPPQDERYIPLLSKPFREQRAIAARNRLAPVNVGNATIKARIGKEGEPPVELSEFEMLIQQVIGEMIQYHVRLNGENSLPIRVTPEQIFRWMYYDGTNMAKPSPEVREKIIKAVDKLIQTPAELHILEQLEKHTKLKSKPGYKKLMKNEGKIIGTLITGRHYGASYNGKVLEDTFVIYDMPMFFYYSSFTGQLLKIDSKLITGESVKTGQTRKTYNDVILREHILYRVNLIKREKKDKNKHIVQQSRYDKKRPKLIDNFTKTILLSTLAEESDITLDTPKKLEVFRNKVIDYMRELEAQGEIKKCEPKYESRRITGVSVTV